MNMTTQKPYDYIVLGTNVRIIIKEQNQSLKVSLEQIVRQLRNPDINPKKRKMYEGALDALQRAGQP